jgi:sec-independent protein translocase protein TatC
MASNENQDSGQAPERTESAQPKNGVAPDRVIDDPYNFHDDDYDYSNHPDPIEDWRKDYEAWAKPAEAEAEAGAGGKAATGITAAPPPAPPARIAPPPSSDPEPEPDEDDDGMLRMSFLEHLEELRGRIIKALMGLAVAFAFSLIFAHRLWLAVSEPAQAALTSLGLPPQLVILSPMEGFSTIYVKLPLLASLFLASPWILWQVWAFIAPGLYRRERKWAAPFVICTAGLFILGGTFAYFVAFRFGLTFLLGIGKDIGVVPYVSASEYFDLFINVTLGIGLVFELPVLIFFLVLLRIVTPAFLVRNSRYAVLAIVVVASILTPTPDVFNLTMFAVPMCLLYFVGVFAGYLLNLQRDKKRFPWMAVLLVAGVVLAMSAGFVYLLMTRYGYRLSGAWPFLVR